MPNGEGDERRLTEVSSFVSDLPAVVQKFWTAVAGPLFELSITLIVLFFALDAGGEFEKNIQSLGTALLSPPPILDSYGLKSLIPIAVVIFLLGIAQANSQLLRVVGASTPGRLIPSRRRLYLKYASAEDISEAWTYDHHLDTAAELGDVIDEIIRLPPAKAATDSFSGARMLRKRSDLLQSTGEFIKGLFVVAFLVVVILNLIGGWPVNWTHLLILFVIFLIAMLYLSIIRMQAEREYEGMKVKEYILYKKMKRANAVVESPLKKVLDEMDGVADDRVWEFKIAPVGAIDDLCALKTALLPGPVWSMMRKKNN
jgi:hypothetical protein